MHINVFKKRFMNMSPFDNTLSYVDTILIIIVFWELYHCSVNKKKMPVGVISILFLDNSLYCNTPTSVIYPNKHNEEFIFGGARF